MTRWQGVVRRRDTDALQAKTRAHATRDEAAEALTSLVGWLSVLQGWENRYIAEVCAIEPPEGAR